MKIKMKTRAAGPSGVWDVGTVLDLPDKQAGQLVAGGYADALEQAPEPEPKQETSKQEAPKRKAGKK